MCFIVWELCPVCECVSKQPTYFQSDKCPADGCTSREELKITSPRSRWGEFQCNTEDCQFNTECSEKLEDQYRSLGNVVPCFRNTPANPPATGTSNVLATQQPLPTLTPSAPVRPACLASISEPASAPGNDEQTPPGSPRGCNVASQSASVRNVPRWAQEKMTTPDMRRARKERKRISFGQPSQGGRVKTQHRSLGTVRMSDLEPELAEAIMAKKEAMEQKIKSQAALLSGRHKYGGLKYVLEEDELLQMLRLNDFSYRQIYTDFMSHRTPAALTHRRNNQAARHAKGFVHIPDDADAKTDTPTIEGAGESSASAGDEMAVDLASTIGDSGQGLPAEDDEMVVDQPDESTEQATPAKPIEFDEAETNKEVKDAVSSNPAEFNEIEMNKEVKEATSGTSADFEDAEVNGVVKQATLAGKVVKAQGSQPVIKTETLVDQPSQAAETSEILV